MTPAQEDFSVTKTRVQGALDQLRSDLAEMREQDLTLLRQFMCIQQTVHMLCRDNVLEKNSYDSSILHSPQPTQDNPPAFERRVHMPLCRVQSAPLQCRSDSLDEIDPLMKSYDSFVGQPLPGSIDEDDELELLEAPKSPSEMEGENENQDDRVSPIHRISVNLDESDSDDEECYRDQQPQCLDLHNHKNNLNHQISLGTKMAPAYSSHYRDILRKSSQIWREIKRSQDDDGHVDARKMAALQLFL
ncbi:hypothetical protein CAPTEDRAFT_199456 [Capitella teleta]|uniref:Uncharacterized protein n=1 Tax=Capitella teleta TaxID=283909 RepID=R7V954_CAPTE|nr:hypothetical protein CAPTEDRAFT_199456 [Capitella teleta]|eukprot:ELU15378.1 hypothetical protein CAPTEDRAFT_199456 [Capitella teleta]